MSYRVFVSAVTKELGPAREEVARLLRRRGIDVTEQKHFRQGGGVLLEKLRDEIQHCDAVVLLMGATSGEGPTAEHAAALGPIEWFGRFAKATGLDSASYTQWEFLLAQQFGKPTFCFFAGPAMQGSADDRQTRFKAWIEQTGKDWNTFDDLGQLAEHVLVLPFPDQPSAKPRSSRFATIGQLFKGRDDELDHLEKALGLQGGGRAAITSKPGALHGLGGVGKTQLAIEFGLAHEDDFSALLFVDGDSMASLRSGLARLANVMHLALPDDAVDDVKVAGALDWLGEHQGWYLVIDNVDDEEVAKAVDGLIGQLTTGSLVVTSRLSRWQRLFTPLELGVLPPDAAVDFLLERTRGGRANGDDDRAQAAALAEDLDHLALALEQAGAYIAERYMGFSEYRRLWRESFEVLNRWYLVQDKGPHDYDRSVEVTWLTSFYALSDAGRRLLEQTSWLAPEPIPAFLCDQERDGAPDRDGLENLLRYSLANRTQLSDGGRGRIPAFSIHRLVQEVARRRQAGKPPPALLSALEWVGAAFEADPQDVRNWSKLDPLAPHIAALTTHADAAGIAQPTATLMNQLGLLWREKARLEEAEPFFRRALAIEEASYGKDDPTVSACLNNLAGLLRAKNRLEEAEPLYRRALAIDEASYHKNHPEVATSLNNLAGLLRVTSRVKEAEPLYRRALAITETSFGKDHPIVATCINNLAGLLEDTNRLEEAERLYRRALAIDETNYGEDHPRVANRLNNLAGVLEETDRVKEGEPLYRRALAITEASYGKEHPIVSICLNNLAELLRAVDRLKEAEPLYRRALAITEASYGKDHPEVATRFNNLAGLLFAANRLDEAEPLFRRALAITEGSYGENHPTVAIRLNNLAILLRATNRLEEAEPLSRRHVLIFLRFTMATGHRHPHLESALGNYSDLLSAAGRNSEHIEREIEGLFREVGLTPK